MENSSFQDKVKGAWIGKCLAGAIGMYFEGVPFTVDLREEDISLAQVPNDDLELQLVWLEALEKNGLALTCRDLGEIWLKRIPHGCDEYSIALYNMKHNIMPPASGYVNNFFADGMGAAIRSEIWALIFAGRPDAAAHFARCDAEVDHFGDGVLGECFMAMAESAAAATGNIEESLRFAWEKTDHNSRLYRTLQKIFAMYDQGVSDSDARKEILITIQNHFNFTDCVMNLAFIVNSLLRGKGDFIKTVLDVISFGRDTDCTAASCGAFLGAAMGVQVIPQKYLAMVSDEIIVSDFVSAIPGVPLSITALTEKTIALHDHFATLLPKEEYPPYIADAAALEHPDLYTARFLILPDDAEDIGGLQKTLMETGVVPEELKKYIKTFNTPYMDLSDHAGPVRLHLFTFLEVNNTTLPEEDSVFMATADSGLRVHLGKRMLLNNHSRHRMLPAFHRTQGGAAFSLPLKKKSRQLLHLELFYTSKPLRACVMIGNCFNDPEDGFDFNIS